MVATGRTSGPTTWRLITTELITTEMATTRLSSVADTSGLTSMSGTQAGGSLAVTGSSVQSELLLAAMAIALGSLLVLLSKPQRRTRRNSATAH